MFKCLSVLSARVPFECPPYNQVSKCTVSAQVSSEYPSAWVSFECWKELYSGIDFNTEWKEFLGSAL